MTKKSNILVKTIVVVTVFCATTLLYSESTTQTEPFQYPPILIREFEEEMGFPLKDRSNLVSFKDVRGFTVLIKGRTDISRIRSAGVLIWTEEPDYVVILGDQKRINALQALGFTLKSIKESDHKLRQVKVHVSDRAQLEHVMRFIADVWPGSDTPDYVYGRAFDYQIKRLQKEGYIVDFIYN